MQTIQVQPGKPHQRFATILDEVPLVLTFRWNATAGLWSVSIFDDNLTELVTSLPLRLGLCGLTVRDERVPAGAFFLVDTTAQYAEPTLEDLGSRVQVRWLPLSEATTADATETVRTGTPTLVEVAP